MGCWNIQYSLWLVPHFPLHITTSSTYFSFQLRWIEKSPHDPLRFLSEYNNKKNPLDSFFYSLAYLVGRYACLFSIRSTLLCLLIVQDLWEKKKEFRFRIPLFSLEIPPTWTCLVVGGIYGSLEFLMEGFFLYYPTVLFTKSFVSSRWWNLLY